LIVGDEIQFTFYELILTRHTDFMKQLTPYCVVLKMLSMKNRCCCLVQHKDFPDG